MELLNLAIKLALIVAAGFTVRRLNIVDANFEKQLSTFVTTLALPCLIIDSLNVEYSASELKNGAMILFVALCTLAMLYIIGYIVYRLRGRDDVGRMVHFGTTFPNFTFVGMPVVEAIYGQEGLFYFVLFTVVVRLFYYSSASPMLSGKKSSNRREAIKNFFSPPIIAVFIGVFLYLTQLHLPTPLESAIESISKMTSPLGMILCGLILGGAQIGDMLRHPSYFVLTLVRLVVAPAIALGILMLTPLNDMIIRVAVLYCALPAAALLPTFTLRYSGSDRASRVASANVFLSTALCVVTLPLWSLILDAVL
jgi:hypothetical protein